MSFRSRLTLFFVLIVIVPMVAVAIVLFRLIGDNETGKADASLAAHQRTAILLFRDETARAGAAAGAVQHDRALAAALRTGDFAAARAAASRLVTAGRARRIVVARGARHVVDVGSPGAVAPARRRLVAAGGGSLGRLEISVAGAGELAGAVRRATGAEALVAVPGRPAAGTIRAPGLRLPAPGSPAEAHIGGRAYRLVTFDAAGFDGTRVRVGVLRADAARRRAMRRAYVVAGATLAGFLALALVFALAVSRSLQAEIGAFLQAARRLGRGDFSASVPTGGSDEFAQLGAEFASMSAQLEARIEELAQERTRLASSLRAVGDAFASNLDRDALLAIVVRTAVQGVQAAGGRALVRAGGAFEERARAGDLTGLEGAVARAEQEAIDRGGTREAAEGEARAVAHALRPATRGGAALGTISVARVGRAFDDDERELFAYLAAQAAVSIQNVGLHEAVSRQAVTDELTGLFNHRRFQEALNAETERARRFAQPLGLVMIDIDDFKAVNDTHGHQQGDRVLAEVARVLRDTARDIDAPARYGGEELAVVLPQTDLDGAFQLAERIRAGIAAITLPLEDGGALRVTASLGVAAIPESAERARELIARADAALYEAKRTGKNKTVRAG
jgi:diguanylate cyclase (GGDEF)-like protein